MSAKIAQLPLSLSSMSDYIADMALIWVDDSCESRCSGGKRKALDDIAPSAPKRLHRERKRRASADDVGEPAAAAACIGKRARTLDDMDIVRDSRKRDFDGVCGLVASQLLKRAAVSTN